MRIYLVTIDSTLSNNNVNSENRATGTSINRNFSLSKGIQNYYLIMAKDERAAKNIVINTFRAKPSVMNDVATCIMAVPLDVITKMLSQNQNVWSYIPIGGVRAPGQQGNNNTMAKLRDMEKNAANENGLKHTNYQVPPPVTYDHQGETSDADLKRAANTDEDRAISGGGVPSMPLPNADGTMDQAQMMAMMQLMMTQMQGGAPAAQLPDVNARANPNQDQELAERIRQNSTHREGDVMTADDQAIINEADNAGARAGDHSSDGRGVNNAQPQQQNIPQDIPQQNMNDEELQGWNDDMNSTDGADEATGPTYE